MVNPLTELAVDSRTSNWNVFIETTLTMEFL